MTRAPAAVEPPAGSAPARVSFGEATRFWWKLGCINFGGPAGQIALMHQELVERRRWIGEQRFLHALNYCMVLPGPEAQQLAIYIGWLLHRTLGGLMAGIAFVLPGAAFMLLLSWIYATFGRLATVQAAFTGLRAAVIAIVAAALLRLAARALRSPLLWVLAVAAFAALALGAPFPAVVLGAGGLGWLLGRLRPDLIPPAREGAAGGAVLDDAGGAPGTPWSNRRALRVIALGLAVWLGPLALLGAALGRDHVLVREGLFFSKAATVTFGGAYAVLAYIQQEAVARQGWLLPGQMVDGLALAETTPGPLILVTEFVGYLGAYRHPGALSPALAGACGAAVTLWATFAPCFLWIFLGAPAIERLRGERRLDAALAAITAAVVGVIAHLAFGLAVHALFRDSSEVPVLAGSLAVPRLASLDGVAALLAVAAFVGLRRWRWPVPAVVLGAAALGLLAHACGIGP